MHTTPHNCSWVRLILGRVRTWRFSYILLSLGQILEGATCVVQKAFLKRGRGTIIGISMRQTSGTPL